MNRDELRQKALSATGRCLQAKGYVAVVDVLMVLGLLAHEDYQRWCRAEVNSLESVLSGSLPRISFVVRTTTQNCVQGGLRPSWTAYMTYGSRPRRPLRFSKSGNPAVERASVSPP
jgi:hypothetical protein